MVVSTSWALPGSVRGNGSMKKWLNRSILTFLRFKLRNRHRLIPQLDALGRFVSEGMFQPLSVVALGEILAGVRAAAFLARQRPLDQRFGDINHSPELDQFQQLRIIAGASVFELDFAVARAGFPELLAHQGQA